MDPFIGLLIIVLVLKAGVDKGRREYRATREHHAAQIARTHPDWHSRKVSRAAGRRALSHWWNELAAWPPFPSLRAAFAEDRLTARAAAEEGRAEGIVRRRDLLERIERALAAQQEHRGPEPLPAGDVPQVPATPEVPPLPSETAGQPGPYAPRDDARPDDSDHLRPGEKRCRDCGGTGRNDAGDGACPICRGWGSEADDPDAPVLPDGTICAACGNPGTGNDPVLDSGSSPVHRSHAIAQQQAYADRRSALANTNGHAPTFPATVLEVPDWRCPNCGGRLEYAELRDSAYCRRCKDLIHRSEVDRAEDWDEPFPEPEDDNWPTGIPHRRSGQQPVTFGASYTPDPAPHCPDCGSGDVRPAGATDGARRLYVCRDCPPETSRTFTHEDAPSPATTEGDRVATRDTNTPDGYWDPYRGPAGPVHQEMRGPGAPAVNGGKAMPTGTDTGIDTALEGADTPHEAMQQAFRQIGARAAEFAQAASDELAAAAAVHGMDRDPQTMADITALADHAQALQQQANSAATGLASRHAEGAEYHANGQDAHASAFRPA